MNRSTTLLPLCLAIGGLLTITGCGGADAPSAPNTEEAGHDHDHDHGHGEHEDHPETYAEAIEQLTSIDQTIRKAFAAKDEEGAHGPLHDIGRLLEDVAALAAKAEMTDEQRTAVLGAVDKLFDLYGAVDETMHGREGKSYDEVSSEIDTALETLKSASTPAAEESSTDEPSE